ncbi:MAG TPA: PfkB family carbohydrate kinase [Bacteroidales bacterium]|nr:PfkB family carbohydrate kinase [Bacteroidales bacterium]
MKKDKLLKLLNSISRVKIAIIGDFCLDAYWFIDESLSEISIETGLPTKPVTEQRYSLGGAGNVANNLAALGVKEVSAFGVIGTDPFGHEMVRIMKETGIDTAGLLVQEKEWHTHTYSKPYAGSKELNRIDFGNLNKLSESTADDLIKKLSEGLTDADVVIINQQVPSGIHTDYLKRQLLDLIGKHPEKTFITDSRSFNDFYTGSIRKMNDTEAMRLCGIIRKPDEPISMSDLSPAAQQLFKKYGKPLFITRGSKGSMIIGSDGVQEIPGLLILSRTDTVGAGDSYLAGAASALAAGFGMNMAAELGTLVAGITVQKLFQTGTATPAEIIGIGADPDFIWNPDLAENPRISKYFEKTSIETVTKADRTITPEHVIFDHDGTVSTMREGWEQIMEPVMINAIFGRSYENAEEIDFSRVRTRVREFIDLTTGIQTISQMHGLVSLVKEFGFVTGKDILTPEGYKKLYNDELMKMVSERESRFRRGELNLSDLTIKNSVIFLKLLAGKGLKLYLASGTDTGDVINEARALGYEKLFEGRIYGSVGDINNDAKKVVLDRILDEIGPAASSKVVTFGDGPVEIRETKKRGGLTVGVASHELRRYGLNLHKRERLIKAGADFIIPDFTQFEQLMKLINL